MNDDPPNPDSMRCPACRASQEWSDICRRCKCDLTLLRESADAYWQGRRAALHHLRDGQPLSALHWARYCESIAPSDETRRLVAVTALLSRDWAAVASALESDGPT
jgi:hypothetical protein